MTYCAGGCGKRATRRITEGDRTFHVCDARLCLLMLQQAAAEAEAQR